MMNGDALAIGRVILDGDKCCVAQRQCGLGSAKRWLMQTDGKYATTAGTTDIAVQIQA
jgi:hypothetical protein